MRPAGAWESTSCRAAVDGPAVPGCAAIVAAPEDGCIECLGCTSRPGRGGGGGTGKGNSSRGTPRRFIEMSGTAGGSGRASTCALLESSSSSAGACAKPPVAAARSEDRTINPTGEGGATTPAGTRAGLDAAEAAVAMGAAACLLGRATMCERPSRPAASDGSGSWPGGSAGSWSSSTIARSPCV